ncbi:HlyD family secretion protein [Agrobacterium sp. SHOUNA12C]|uniref:Protein secretion protein n=2 Tax=Rhizobium rhizogenes TaxID=359 RepID=B9JFD3_RHIR8|nr:HlyD family secretion protein [Rhizobium rhizogenes]ACM26623.1 protein secretion protein [Rhizobium rhizogenes K84]KAA6489631.1 HlyD family secretion protein [Agrobacterium sp. ICMP 7243]MCJ9721524.1 HlyD family secretion protein [Agrobacterium sp. BETTINA12B]MCJ9756304.1 HlyD family secretion protein [Agrobacterium sp. SHOUNA12C]OCJ06083.1 hemolysin secretion protein D [Agrobacterium sp. 13-626]OCJ25710.1 hemolysin secretion protein D [Agrobacterium sp. B131/95]OCJ31192.1 hemolysin secre
MADASSPLRVPANANSASEQNQAAVAEAPSSNPAPAPAAAGAAAPAAAPEKPRKRRSPTRPILFALLPVALVVGGYYYVTGGQIMSTDNAYVQADMVGVSTDVSGTVISVDVHENEVVKKGQVLFRLKPDSFRITLEGAQAQLGNARNQILNLQASYKQSLAEIAQAQADIPYYQNEYERQQNLINSSVASKAAYDQAKHNLDAAQQKVSVAQAQAATTLAQLGGNADLPVEQNPLYLQAKAAVDNAQRELDDTVVRAPFDGITTNVPSLQVGAYLTAAQQGFSLVSTTNMWINASPKETELTYVKTGQKVTISVDAYPGVTWKGTVSSIAPASGASFSLLPAQNTTGNWVKVVQRIPMIISIDDTQGKPPLRVGMSVVAGVDTGHARGLPDSIASLLGQSHGQDHE